MITNTIQYVVSDTFNGGNPFSISMPYNRARSKDGYYSRKWKAVKKSSIISGLVKPEHMKMTIIRSRDNMQNRILFEFGCGVKIYMPDDASDYDYEILFAQLRVLQMAAPKE